MERCHTLPEKPLQWQLACLFDGSCRHYGLVSEEKYYKVAVVQPSRYGDCQEELLDAILLHAKKLPRQTEIQLPQELANHVKEEHLKLLTSYGKYEYLKDNLGELNIHSSGCNPEVRRIFDSFKIVEAN